MTVLVIAALLAVGLSLVVNARQFLANLELVKHRDELLQRLTGGTNGSIQEITERQSRDFDAALCARRSRRNTGGGQDATGFSGAGAVIGPSSADFAGELRTRRSRMG